MRFCDDHVVYCTYVVTYVLNATHRNRLCTIYDAFACFVGDTITVNRLRMFVSVMMIRHMIYYTIYEHVRCP